MRQNFYLEIKCWIFMYVEIHCRLDEYHKIWHYNSVFLLKKPKTTILLENCLKVYQRKKYEYPNHIFYTMVRNQTQLLTLLKTSILNYWTSLTKNHNTYPRQNQITNTYKWTFQQFHYIKSSHNNISKLETN